MTRARGWLVSLIAVPLTCVLVAGVAWSYWSAASLPGGNGAAAAASMDGGRAPTAVAAGADVEVGWPASALSSGDPVDGYLVRRYDAQTMTLHSIQAGCAGTVITTTCTESGVPGGLWVYSVTPVLAAHWVGAESPLSNQVTTDSTAPANSVSMNVVTGAAFQAAGTLYYRGSAAGSFTLTNTVTDADSGPASSTTSPLTGGSTGWTHDPSTVSAPTGGPYVSAPFGWAAGTTSSPAEMVTGRDLSGNTASTNLSLVDDSSAPTPGSLTYPEGYQPDRSVVVSFTTGTDPGSGIATRQLQRSSAELVDGACRDFTGFADVGPQAPTSPYTDDAVSDGSCYQYRYLVTDRVGNQDVAVSSRVAIVDPAGRGPLRSATSYSVLAGTGVVSTGITTVSGDLGVSPSTSVVGFPPGIVGGTTHAGDAAAAQAQADLVLAYDAANAATPTSSFTGDQNGKTFHAGVHHTGAAFALTGTLTLDADGDPDALFVFQVDAAMNTAASSNVVLVDGAEASNVYWQVEGATGTGASSTLVGTIMSAGGVTLGDSTVLIGRALSYGTVTMANNTIRFTSAPSPTITLDGGDNAVTKDTTPTISGTSNAAGGTRVVVRVAGQVLTTTVQVDSTWTVTAATPLTAGDHPVVASVRDAAGNAGTDSQTLTVEVNPAPVTLGTAATYSVLARTSVTNTDATTLSGDLGISPGITVSGFPPGVVAGDTHIDDAAAAQAQAALLAAYTEIDGRTPHRLIPGELAGKTFHAGIYHATVALALTGTVTLDGEGNPDAVFVFQGDAAMNTSASSNVNLINGAKAYNVFWQVEGALGTGASTTFSGTILAGGAITLGASTRLIGAALSRDAVTLAGNTVRFTAALPPTVTITGGAAAVTKDTTPTISGTSGAPPTTAVSVMVAGQLLTTSVQSGGSWTVTAPAPLTAGVHTVTASVRDAAGNAGSATQSLTVEVNPAPISLGTASAYSVLAVTAVTNTGLSVLDGDVGVVTPDTITGFPPGTTTGVIRNGGAAVAQAQADLTTAYDNADNRTPSTEFAGDLNNRVFHAGVHHTAAALALTGTVTLDGENNPDAVFVFQVDAAMNTAALSTVSLINGAQASNVYWQVEGAVVTGASSSLSGTVLADGGVSLGLAAQLSGRALSRGTVLLKTNLVTTG